VAQHEPAPRLEVPLRGRALGEREDLDHQVVGHRALGEAPDGAAEQDDVFHRALFGLRQLRRNRLRQLGIALGR
jgi:hypothetical protein